MRQRLAIIADPHELCRQEENNGSLASIHHVGSARKGSPHWAPCSMATEPCAEGIRCPARNTPNTWASMSSRPLHDAGPEGDSIGKDRRVETAQCDGRVTGTAWQ